MASCYDTRRVRNGRLLGNSNGGWASCVGKRGRPIPGFKPEEHLHLEDEFVPLFWAENELKMIQEENRWMDAAYEEEIFLREWDLY